MSLEYEPRVEPTGPLPAPDRPRSRAQLLVGLVAAVFAVGLLAALATGVTCGCSLPPPTPDITSPVDGVVISVDAAGIADVRGFTLRPSTSPFAFGFKLGVLENPTEFSPSHLAEHQATSSPVRVWFRVENGEKVVYRLEDAPRPPAAT